MFSENIIFDLPLHIRYNPLHCFANLTSKNLKQSTSPGFSPSFSNTQNRKAKQSVSTAIQKLGLLSYFHMHFCLSWKKNLDLEEPLNTCHSSCPHNNPSSARLDLLARAAPGQRLSSLALPPGELLLHQAGRSSASPTPEETLK